MCIGLYKLAHGTYAVCSPFHAYLESRIKLCTSRVCKLCTAILDEALLRSWLGKIILRPLDTSSNLQAPGFVVINDAHHTPSDQVNNYAAVGETVEYNIVSTNNGNVDISGATAEGSMTPGYLFKPSYRYNVAGLVNTLDSFHQTELSNRVSARAQHEAYSFHGPFVAVFLEANLIDHPV